MVFKIVNFGLRLKYYYLKKYQILEFIVNFCNLNYISLNKINNKIISIF
jgi:hypothetical protein